MAEGYFHALAPGYKVSSAGLVVYPENENKPISNSTTKSIQVMKEEEIDIAQSPMKQLTLQMVEEADRVVVLAPEMSLPDYLENSPKLERWDIPDAGGKDYDFYLKNRALIKEKILDLISRLENN